MSEALKQELVFYGSYHSDGMNKLIHAICVPLLLWTGFAMFAPLEIMVLNVAGTDVTVTVAYVVSAIYILYYIYLFPAVGFITAPILAGIVYSAHAYWRWGLDHGMAILVAVHVVSWIAQFIGHGKFEGRRPALFDSLMQALLTAPFFVFFEYCFCFGLFQDLHHEVQRRVYTEIRKLESQKLD